MADVVLKNGGAAYVPPDLLNDTSTPDLNPDYFDVVITDLKPDTDYAMQFAWVFEDKTLSPYSANYDVRTAAITIPEVSNIATEWTKSTFKLTFDRPEETIEGIVTSMANSFIITLTHDNVDYSWKPNVTDSKSQTFTLSDSVSSSIWRNSDGSKKLPTSFTGKIQVVNLDGTSDGVTFTSNSATDPFAGRNIPDSEWPVTSVLDGYFVTIAQFTTADEQEFYDYTELWEQVSGTWVLIDKDRTILKHQYVSDLSSKSIKIRYKSKSGVYSNYSNVKVIKAADPSGYDANGPSNEGNITAGTPEIDGDALFDFNYKVQFSWPQENDSTALGYRLRWRIQGSSDPYTYTLVPGLTTTSTYLFGVLAGQTYEVGKNTYDEYGNTTAAWKSTTVTIPAFTGEIKGDKYLAAGNMKLGYGIGGNNTNRGLYLGTSNYWYVSGNTVADNAARIKIGSPDSYLEWNGTDLITTGIINALGGNFTGSVSVGGVTSSGTTIPGQLRVIQEWENSTTPKTGIEIGKLNQTYVTVPDVTLTSGIYAYNKQSGKYVLINAADGSIRANNAYINGTITSFGSPGTWTSNTLTVSGGKITADEVIYMESSGWVDITATSGLSINASTEITGDIQLSGNTTVNGNARTSYSTPTNTGYFRNIWMLSYDPTSQGQDGDVWFTYT